MADAAAVVVNMEEEVSRLVEKTWARYEALPANGRLLIGIAGIPGSGKSTFASAVAARLQALHAQRTSSPELFAQCLSMDGFHLPRSALDAMSDPVRAHARRGAAFTFDAPGFLSLITSLRTNTPKTTTTTTSIFAPSFDHAKKDPVEADVEVPPSARIVIVEGNYVALDEPLWRDARALFDEVWFVEVDLEVAKERLGKRHVQAGIAETMEEGRKRAVENDIPNGREIISKLLPVDEIIQSR